MSASKTIIFVDIRGFTRACQRSDLVLSINEFLDSFYSLLDACFPSAARKFLGDGAMLVSDMSDPEEILASIEKSRREFADLRSSFSQDIGVDIDMELGFGVSRGTVITLQRQSREANIAIHDFVSPRINLAARLCSLARPSGIVLHKESFPDLPSSVQSSFDLTVFKDIPGLETQDVRCWVEKGVVFANKTRSRVEALNVEVHVTGLAFRDGKLLLCERGERREIDPLRWSGPGGKLRANAPFEEALAQVFAREVGVGIAQVRLLNTYFIDELRIPGLVFYCQIPHGEPFNKDGKNLRIRFFAEDEIAAVSDYLSPTLEVVKKAFAADRNSVRVPVRVRALLSTRCDFSCRYCHHEHVYSDEAGRTEKIATTLDEVEQTFDLYHITLTGGEPLLPSCAEDFFTLVEFIRSSMGYTGPLCVITHGRYLTDANLQRLLRFDVALKISLYAFDDEGFARYTGAEWPSYFEDILNRCAAIEKMGLSYSLNVILRKSVNDDLPLFIERLNGVGLRPGKIKFIEMVMPTGNPVEFAESFLSIEKCSLFHDDYVTDGNGGFRHRFRMAYKGQTLEFYRYPCQDPANCMNCVEKWDMIVRPAGELQVCRHVFGDNPRLLGLFGSLRCEVVREDYRERYFQEEAHARPSPSAGERAK